MKIIYNDLISREEAIALIEEWRQFALGHNEYGEKLAGCIKAGVEKIPSAEKTGKWIMLDPRKHIFYCRACGQLGERYWNYCPNCGARMK